MEHTYNKIDFSIASKVLFLGIDWRNPKGGIASVEKVYATIFSPFQFVCTVVNGSSILKLFIFIVAVFHFLYYMVFKKNIKIVHVHGASNTSFYRKRIFIYWAKFFNKKVVYHVHGGGFKEFALKHGTIVKDTLKKCDVVVVLSNSWKDFFVKELGCKNVVIIKNPIEYPVYNHLSKQGPCILLFLGLLCKEKGIYDLLEVISENKNVYKNKLILRFAGNGDVRYVLNILKQLKIEDLAFYEGWVSGNKKIELLNKADIYVLPSYYEGLPISILESMAYHLPIISTNVGGIPEILKNEINGFIIEPGDKKGLKNAINQLLDNVEIRKKMGLVSAEMVREYLPDSVEKQLEDLYSELLGY